LPNYNNVYDSLLIYDTFNEDNIIIMHTSFFSVFVDTFSCYLITYNHIHVYCFSLLIGSCILDTVHSLSFVSNYKKHHVPKYCNHIHSGCCNHKEENIFIHLLKRWNPNSFLFDVTQHDSFGHCSLFPVSISGIKPAQSEMPRMPQTPYLIPQLLCPRYLHPTFQTRSFATWYIS
jgi:hypothetical protein